MSDNPTTPPPATTEPPRTLTIAEQTLIAELRRIQTQSKHTMVIVRTDGLAWQVFKAVPVGKIKLE